MEIKTKYNLGDKIWIVYEANLPNNQPSGELNIYDDTITEIIMTKDGIIYVPEIGYEEVKEEDVILYNDKQKLTETIYKKMQKINERDGI